MMGSSQSNRSGSDANKSSFQFHPVLSGTNTNTQITVIIVNSSQGSSFCQQSIMKETAHGESNRTDGSVVCQAAGCGCALTEASPESSQSNHSGSDANKSSFHVEFHPVLSGTNTNTQITVVMVNSSHGSSFCQQSIMKETAQGESNRTDGGVVCQAAGCGCALTEASPELGQAVVSSHMKLLNWNTPIRLVKVAPLLTSLGHETLLNWKTSTLDRASKNCTTFMASLRAT